MKLTTTLPRHSRRKAAKDSQAAPAQSPSPPRRSPNKQDETGGKSPLSPALPSITFAAVHAANAAAVTATNPFWNLAAPSAPAEHAAALVHCTCSL
jgi:hypothetical protein